MTLLLPPNSQPPPPILRFNSSQRNTHLPLRPFGDHSGWDPGQQRVSLSLEGLWPLDPFSCLTPCLKKTFFFPLWVRGAVVNDHSDLSTLKEGEGGGVESRSKVGAFFACPGVTDLLSPG